MGTIRHARISGLHLATTVISGVVEPVRCETDEGAVAAAKGLINECDVELWQANAR